MRLSIRWEYYRITFRNIINVNLHDNIYMIIYIYSVKKTLK